jgi:hypothetical protein
MEKKTYIEKQTIPIPTLTPIPNSGSWLPGSCGLTIPMSGRLHLGGI